ncbi:MAG: ABC transporter permease subunit [Gammaproteobacteria bacterium]|nr:ABC transporter permease subunit [Gammaproteobacteria bacterium]
MKGLVRATLLVLMLGSFSGAIAAAETISVGSKNFNENYVLAEIIAQLFEARGFEVDRRFGLGGTLICYEALKKGDIDVYVEYSGTLSQAILKLSGQPSKAALNQLLATEHLQLLDDFGFNNTYAIVVREEDALARNLNSIGDLAGVDDLPMMFSHEFLERQDGWPGLAQSYGLQQVVTGIEHGLAYQAISDGAVGVTDAYSTDGELVRYKLRILQDDRKYFPEYFAAPLVSRDLPVAALNALAELSNTITNEQMQALNAQVVFGGKNFAQVASGFLASRKLASGSEFSAHSIWPNLIRNTLRHLQLTGIALGLAIVFGLALSLFVYRFEKTANGIIYFCGLLQTIPSIALLALMIPLFGIGMLPAVVALFLYSLLPILRNAITALREIEPTLIRVAVALGLSQKERLRYVLVPLALPQIFAGVRTAAVISIGTATLAAFIGAGGLGDPIVVGLALGDVEMILQGAIPAAILAILTEMSFGLLQNKLSGRR